MIPFPLFAIVSINTLRPASLSGAVLAVSLDPDYLTCVGSELSQGPSAVHQVAVVRRANVAVAPQLPFSARLRREMVRTN